MKVAIAAILVSCFAYYGYLESLGVPEFKFDPKVLYEVSEVVDGDTFRVKVGEGTATVRMLGINTPETVDPRKSPECFGAEASLQTKKLISHGRVRLVANPNRELKDKYGRYLFYVYREDSLFINEELIRDGFAREYTYGSPYSFQADFRAAQKQAKSKKLGLWGSCVIKGK